MNSDKNNNQSEESNDDCSMDSFPVPGLSEYVTLQSPNQSPPSWSRGMTPDDINLMHQLGTLSTSNLILEVKKLHDLAYKLGVEEAKEMTRGKYLNVFTSRRQRLDY